MSFAKSSTLVHVATNEVDVVVTARVQQSGNGFYGNVPLLGPIIIQMRAGNRQKGSAVERSSGARLQPNGCALNMFKSMFFELQ